MALAIAPWEERTRWWDSKARQKNGISLEDIAAKHNFSNNHEPEPQMEVDWDSTLREIDKIIMANNRASSARLVPEDVADFNASYNKGIEHIVENAHAGLFEIIAGKVYAAA